MTKGYELADGSYSIEYKEGDKFVVVDKGNHPDVENGQVITLSHNDGSSFPYFNNNTVCVFWDKLRPDGSVSAKKNLEQLLSSRGEEVIEWLTEKLKEFDKQQNIKKELKFAKAKRERLDKHITVLEEKLK